MVQQENTAATPHPGAYVAAVTNSTFSPPTPHEPITDEPITEEPTGQGSHAQVSAAYASSIRLPSTTLLEDAIQNTDTQSQTATAAEVSHDESVSYDSMNNTAPSQVSQSKITPQLRNRLAIKESIGNSGILALMGGTLASIASICFLIFLWTGQGSSPKAVNAPQLWRLIVLRGWTAQATTLASLLIRIAVASQATVCTAMLAALFLEKHRVPKFDAAQFSIIRAINDGPLKLTRLVLRPSSHMISIEAALVAHLAISSLALQFSSTILFSDFRDISIAANIAPFPVNDYVAGNGDYSLHIIDITTHPPINAVFGELPSNASSEPDHNGFSATGPKTRAFPPLRDPNNRTAIYSYSGNAIALSSSIACMRANIQSSSYRGYSSGRASYPVDVGQITGTLHYGESLREARSVENLCNSEECLMAEFNCSLAAAYSDFNPGWESSLCTADVIGGGYWHGNYSLGWDLGTEPWSNQSLVYLLFSTNMYTSDWQTSRESRSLDNAPRTDIGEWSSYEIQDNRFINVTLCFSSIHANLTSVDMTATGNLVEPVGNWSATGFGNSSEVRKYLSASEDPATPADRGILTITHIKAPDNLSPWEPYDEDSEQPNQTLAELGGSQFEEAIYRALAGYDTPNATFQACSLCEFEGLGQHPELAAIIQDTIGETGRAADALQAYTTSVGNTFHQYFLKAFNGTEEVHIAFIKTVQVAGACHENGCKGLISVASLLALHLLCVALTTYRYVRLTRYSRQGNAWHAVSQLTGPELEAAVRRGNDMCDDALVKELKGEKSDVFVTLRKMDSGRIDIVESVEKFKNIQQ